MDTHEVVYGRFSDPARTYVVTNASMPDTIRVFAGDPHVAEMVCSISNLSVRPYPSWNAKWYSNTRDWKHRFTTRAVDVYRTGSSRPRFRACDG